MEQQIRFLVEQYYDIQKLRVEAFNRIVAYVKSHNIVGTQIRHASQPEIEPQTKNASQKPNETQMEVAVKPSTIAHKIIKNKLPVPSEIKDLVWYHNSLLYTEKELAKRLDAWSSHHPLRINWLSKIYGVGPILSSALIAWLGPISRFDNISKLWKYCGMAPGQKRKRGQKINYNPHLKTLMWKIASSFEKQKATKSRYRRIYDEKKRYYLNRPDLHEAIEKKKKGAKLHVRLMAMRFTVKRFLADTWIVWRKMEGLPVTKPYAHTILHHTDFVIPQPDKVDEEEEIW